MSTVTLTLKLPFLSLNNCKNELFKELQEENTRVGNEMLKLPAPERRALTTADYESHPLASYWMNQTIRTVNKSKTVKHFKRVPLQTNNQGWTLTKVGSTFSVGFTLNRGGRGKRAPLSVHAANHASILQTLIDEAPLEADDRTIKRGNLQLHQNSSGSWFALLSVTLDVPEATPAAGRWVGVDRGKNHVAVAVTPEGRSMFFPGGPVKELRTRHQTLRRNLQTNGKHRLIKKLEAKEQRAMRAVNHAISKNIVDFAKRHECGIILENLKGIRNAKQRQAQRKNAATSLHTWAYYDLEQKIRYKAALIGVPVEARPAAYTTQTCSRCGHLNKRRKHAYHCTHCKYQVHADWNASKNLGAWDGKTCSLELNKEPTVIAGSVRAGGVHDAPLNSVTASASIQARREKENLHPQSQD